MTVVGGGGGSVGGVSMVVVATGTRRTRRSLGVRRRWLFCRRGWDEGVGC